MGRRSRYPRDIFMQLDGARRVGWAKYYEEAERARQSQFLADIYRERNDTLATALLDLTDTVLRCRNIDAFAFAWHVRRIVDEYEQGRPT